MNGKIKVRHIYKAAELKRFAKLEGKYHHMGETHSGGDTMRIVFEDEDGEWLALMVWGSACYHLRPRDEYIGWNMALRRARQKLVVINRRFTMLARTLALYFFAKSGMSNCLAFKEKMQANPDMAFDLVMREEA